MDQDGATTRGTPFVSRSNDEDNLWAAHEITQESDTEYKIKWAGTDPQTGKPWPQSWVPKWDCTGTLVAKWEAKMKSSKETPHNSCKDDGGSIGSVRRPKRKRQLKEADIESVTDGCNRDVMEAAKMKRSEKHRLEMYTPSRATPLNRVEHQNEDGDSYSTCQPTVIVRSPKIPSDNTSIKVGPPRRVVHKKRPILPQLPAPPSVASTPVMGHRMSPSTSTSLEAFDQMTGPGGQKNLSEKSKKVADEEGRAPADASRNLGAIVLKRQPTLGSPDPSNVRGVSSMAKILSPTGSTRGVSDAFKAFGNLKVQFTNIEANILTLHGLVKKAEAQLGEAMRELEELGVSLG